MLGGGTLDLSDSDDVVYEYFIEIFFWYTFFVLGRARSIVGSFSRCVLLRFVGLGILCG